jgi:hypothetical protein
MKTYILTIVALLASAATASAVTLVEDGKPLAAIVVSEDALAAKPYKPRAGMRCTELSAAQKQRLAATELQRYVEKMSGAKLPLLCETEQTSGAVVLVGAGKKVAAMNLRIPTGVTPQRREEGYLIYARGQTLVLAGNDDGPYQGTFFAVSEFLNRQGVRWFMPSEFGECVPRAATIKVADVEYRDAPDFIVRSWSGNLAPQRMCILTCLLFAGGGKGASSAQAPVQLPIMENKDAQIPAPPEIGPCFYQQTIFYDGLGEERSMVKDKLAKAKTGQDKREAVTLDGLVKQKEEVLSDLKTHLEKISGKGFLVADNILQSGIVLARTSSRNVPLDMKKRLEGKGLEAFLICSEKTDRLWIVANDRRGLSHGVYYYLEQLGVRWLMTGKNWTVIPSRKGIAINMDRLVEPSFIGREYVGGIYNQLWNRKYRGNAEFEQEWQLWSRRMRKGGMGLGKAVGEAFITENAEVLAQHPEYLAKIDGKYSPLYVPTKASVFANYVWDESTKRFVKAAKPGTGTHQVNIIAKLNAGNPAAVALFSDWIMEKLRKTKAGPEGYAVTTVSVEPSDGSGEGNNYDELKAQGVGDGSESDQEFFIGNACARKVRAEFPEVSVIMLAYAARSDPPSFPLEPNFIVQPCSWRGGRKTARLSEDEWLATWKAKSEPNPMATYVYWSIFEWTHDQPEFNYLDLANRLRRYYSYNIKALFAETTTGGGAMGIGQYLAAHLMWDIHLDERALIEDWYENAFGPAREPMKRMMERWARHYHPISSELGSSYQDIAEAEKLAAGNEAVLARVDDYARYLHYLRLYCEYLNAPGLEKASGLVEYQLDINDARMTRTSRAIDLFVFQQRYPSLKDQFHLADKTNENNGPGWARVHSLSHAEVVSLINDGMRTYPPPDFEFKTYTGKLVALHPSAWNTPDGGPWGVPMTIATATMDLQIPDGLSAFPLRVSRNHATRVTVTDDTGKTFFMHWVEPVGKDTNDPKGAPWDEMSIPLAPGHYQVVVDGGKAANFTFQTWKGVPLTLRTVQIQKGNYSPRFYFFVPKGLGKVAIFFPYGVRAGGIEPPFCQPDGQLAKIEERSGGRLVVIPVPAGMDSKVWSLEHLVQPYQNFEALNFPQAFSLSPDVLLVPSDAIIGGNAHERRPQ